MNIDCVLRTAVVAMSKGGGGEVVLTSNCVHQMCHNWGGGGNEGGGKGVGSLVSNVSSICVTMGGKGGRGKGWGP